MVEGITLEWLGFQMMLRIRTFRWKYKYKYKILDKTDLNLSSQNIEVCHFIGKSKYFSKTTIVGFVNRKHAKKALANRKDTKNIDRSSVGLEKSHSIFINKKFDPNK